MSEAELQSKRHYWVDEGNNYHDLSKAVSNAMQRYAEAYHQSELAKIIEEIVISEYEHTTDILNMLEKLKQ